MEQLVKEVESLLAFLEPDLTSKDIRLKISNCLMGTDHTHLYPNTINPAPDMPNIKEISLKELNYLNVLDLRDHLQLENINYLLDSLLDVELAAALGELKALKNMQPLDNDIDKINSSLLEISNLIDLSYEYIDFENDTYQALSECHGYQSQGKYMDTLNKEAVRVVDDVEQIRKLTLGSTQAISLLQKLAEDTLSVDLDHSEVLVLAGRLEMQQRDDSSPEHRYLTPIWLAFNNTNGLYQSELSIMPTWAVELLSKISPSAIQSEKYPKDIMDTKEFAVAKALHRDGGIYQNFDLALKAASQL